MSECHMQFLHNLEMHSLHSVIIDQLVLNTYQAIYQANV